MIILSEFSKTFTRSDMPTAWSTIVQSNLLPAKYVADRNALYEKYHSYELSGDVEMTERWFREHLKLFVKHHLTDEMIEQIVLDDRFFAPRDGVKEFLDMVREKNVPLIIVSSGISDCIRIWFKKRFDYVPSEIISNGLKWDYGTAVAIDDEILITPLDKHIDLELETEAEVDYVLLLGDNQEDLDIFPEADKTIGFTDEYEYDVKLGKEGTFLDVIPYLNV